MIIKVAKRGSRYSSSFLPGQLFNSKAELVKAAKIKLAGERGSSCSGCGSKWGSINRVSIESKK